MTNGSNDAIVFINSCSDFGNFGIIGKIPHRAMAPGIVDGHIVFWIDFRWFHRMVDFVVINSIIPKFLIDWIAQIKTIYGRCSAIWTHEINRIMVF
ncbi:hypothetical protein D9M72_644310 [compost metagenome]